MRCAPAQTKSSAPARRHTKPLRFNGHIFCPLDCSELYIPCRISFQPRQRSKYSRQGLRWRNTQWNVIHAALRGGQRETCCRSLHSTPPPGCLRERLASSTPKACEDVIETVIARLAVALSK